MILSADRLEHIHEYYFSKKLREVRLLMNSGQDIINLGVGSPDLQPPEQAIKALAMAMQDLKAHQYQPYKGIPELREAIAKFYQTYYSVHLDPEQNILPLIGSKEGITHISMAFLNEGDEVLLPNPGYPTYTSVTRLVGAKPVFYQLKASLDYQPDFEALEQRITPKTKLMWVSYPHMPTGAKPKADTFKRLKDFARKNNVLVVNDNPYSLTLNDKPESFLEDLNTNDTILELNSLSKSFNLAGWRVGMLCGHENLVNTVLKVKSNVDSGMFYGIQKGAIAAMNSSKDFIIHQNGIYQKRRELIWELCRQLELEYDTHSAGLFVWAKVKTGKTSVQFSDEMLYNCQLFITPGHVFGSAGEGYVRFSLCVDESQIKTAIERTKTLTT